MLIFILLFRFGRIVRNKAAEKAKHCITNNNSNSQNNSSSISPSTPNNATSVIVNANQQQQTTPTAATYSINGILGIEDIQRHKRKNPSPNENHIESEYFIPVICLSNKWPREEKYYHHHKFSLCVDLFSFCQQKKKLRRQKKSLHFF